MKKKKKGFTLVELSVTIAVSAIALAMLSVCFVAIQSFFRSKELRSQYVYELNLFNSVFTKTINEYSTTDYILTENNNETAIVIFTQNTTTFEISLTEPNQKGITTLQLGVSTQEQSITLNTFVYIDSIKFTTSTNLIKCKVIYGDNQELVYIYSTLS